MKVTLVMFALATTTAAYAEPAPVHKGFVEGGAGWGYAMSNVQFLEVNNGTLLAPPHASGFELDVAGGYELVPGISIIGDLQHASATSIQGSGGNGATVQYSSSYNSLTVGVRTAHAVGSGELYADFAIGAAFPFDTHADGTFGGGGGGGGGTAHLTVGYNSGFGGRGEMGYHFTLNDRMYLGAGLRLEAFSTDNVGRTRVRVDQNGQTTTETYTTDPTGQGPTPSALSVQDLRLRISFGYRF
ncbi:MAG: outer membrane beta-barrel protein [Deltaproteobacteria bacterium]|nr:outer membrane beta-barrel protein [Deltaproteobacteria bacterium]